MTHPHTTARPQLIVGTAGHIDHGKSRLVHALTGSDPDRLPEEKARGMTIELGFAYADIAGCDIWFVDVPGHEKFIRNMVAGAAGVDLALLVVAADDSVMPQTREHAEVLRLLGMRQCLVVLSKLDLVDDEWAEAVEEEISELLDELGIEPIAMIRTSAETGAGLDALREALAAAARAPRPGRLPYHWFRLPVDRAFTIAGRGTVVTGSLMHGTIAANDELELWPAGRRVRGRDLQTHHEGRTAAGGHMRLAVNLAGVSLDAVHRGCELASPGYLEPTRCLHVWLDHLRAPGKAFRSRTRLRLHIATSEVRAELRLVDDARTATVAGVYAQLRSDEPIVATWGQRFILRDDSATRTLGGGMVLRPRAWPISSKHPPDHAALEQLRTGQPKQRLLAALQDQRWPAASAAQLASRAGLADVGEAERRLRQLCVEQRVVALGEPVAECMVTRDLLDAAAEHIVERLRRQAGENPRWPGVARREWPGWMPRACPERLRAALSEWLIRSDRVRVVREFILPPDHVAAMSAADTQLYEALLAEIYAGAFQPPAVAALRCRTPANAKRVDELIDLAVARGELRRLADGIWLHQRRWDELVEIVRRLLAERGPFTVSELRTALDSSRKYVVPLAESLDAAGITRRQGDKRTAGPTM